jgi:hypothetical protein
MYKYRYIYRLFQKKEEGGRFIGYKKLQRIYSSSKPPLHFKKGRKGGKEERLRVPIARCGA